MKVQMTPEIKEAIRLLSLMPEIGTAIKENNNDLKAIGAFDEVMTQLYKLAESDNRINVLIEPLVPYQEKVHKNYKLSEIQEN